MDPNDPYISIYIYRMDPVLFGRKAQCSLRSRNRDLCASLGAEEGISQLFGTPEQGSFIIIFYYFLPYGKFCVAKKQSI
jgi:hypothetical protein